MAAAVLAVTVPYWSALPALTGMAAAQVFLGAVVYVIEILFMASLVVAVVDGRLKLIAVSAALGSRRSLRAAGRYGR